MTSFGLGLVLNFVDNATSGMQNATNTFITMSNTIQNASKTTNTAMQDMFAGSVLNTLGTSLTNFGNSVVSVVSGIMNNVNRVGADFQAFRVTMNQLYGDSVETEKQLNKLLTFSVKSPFEVADTKDLLVVLKSQGIEAFDSIRGAITGVEQETLTWLSDLMAFKPDVPLQKWKLAFQNYIGSGEQKMLRNVLDMGQISEIIGHSIGSTTEERLNDIIEIVEKKNLRGLTKSMMKTPTAVLSNISDFFTMFYKAIGDAGVFDSLFAILKSVSNLLNEFSIESGKLPKIAQIFSDAFNLILRPIISITEKATALVRSFLDFAIAHPALAKLVIVLFALAGASAVAIGWVLKLSGSILMFSASIKLLGGIKTVMSLIGQGFSILGGKIIGLVPLGILLYQAWKNKFLGIQGVVGSTSRKLGLIWDYFKKGYFTDEEYNLAQQLGILVTIEKIEKLRYLWDSFKTGFAKGWNKAFETMFNALEAGLLRIDAVLKGLGIDSGLSAVIELLGMSFDALFSPENKENAEAIGKSLGEIAASLVVILGVCKAFNVVISIIKGVGAAFKGLATAIKWVGKALGLLKISAFLKDFGAFLSLVRSGNGVWASLTAWFPKITSALTTIGGLFTKLGGWLSAAGKAIWSGIGYIASALGISVWWVVAIIAAIIAAVTLIVVFWDEICYFFTDMLPNALKAAWNAVANFFKSVWTTIVNSPIVQAVVKVVSAIWNVIWSIVKVVAQVFMLVYSIVKGVISTIVAIVVSLFRVIWSVISGIAKVIWQVIVGIWNVIKGVFNVIYQFIRAIFMGIVFVVMWVAKGIQTAFLAIWNFLKPIIQAIGNAFVSVWNWIKGVWNTVANWFGSIFNAIWNFCSPILTTIGNFFSSVASWVQSVWQGVSDWFSGVFDTISDWATTACDAIAGAFDWVAQKVKSFFDWISSGLEAVGDFFAGIGDWFAGNMPSFAVGVTSFEGGRAIINERGGEIVDLPKGTRVIPHDKSVRESLNEGIRLGARAMSAFNAVNSNGTPISSNSRSGSVTDNSVTFAQGSIVITTVGATQSEMEKAAEFIMRYIARKQKLRSLAVR